MLFFDLFCYIFVIVLIFGYLFYNVSVGYFDGVYIYWVVIVFMFFGGVLFVFFFYLLCGDWKVVIYNIELCLYCVLMVGLCFVVVVVFWNGLIYVLFDVF